ncbi:MAG: YeeE/YedE family protein [Gemmatimonadaceae bacterium]
MLRWFTQPWPWYVAGPLIGVLVPVLLLIGNKTLGVSSSLRAMCAALIPGNVEFFNYDWRTSGLWNVALALGIVAGAALTAAVVGVSTPAITPATRDAIATLGVHRVAGLVPAEIFSWRALLTVRGAACIVGGGFLIGFGASYAGGCTSGHGIMGLASLQKASLVAIVAIFAGGLLATYVLMPMIL